MAFFYAMTGTSLAIQLAVIALCFTAVRYLMKLPEKNYLVMAFYTAASIEVCLRVAEKSGWIIDGCVSSDIALWPGNVAMGLMLLMYMIQALSTFHLFWILRAYQNENGDDETV